MNALNVAQTQPEAVRGMNRGMRQQPAPELMVADARHSVVPVVPPHTLVFRKEMQSTSAPMPDGLGAVGLPEVIGLPTSVGAAQAYNTGARLEERRDLRRGGSTLS